MSKILVSVLVGFLIQVAAVQANTGGLLPSNYERVCRVKKADLQVSKNKWVEDTRGYDVTHYKYSSVYDQHYLCSEQECYGINKLVKALDTTADPIKVCKQYKDKVDEVLLTYNKPGIISKDDKEERDREIGMAKTLHMLCVEYGVKHSPYSAKDYIQCPAGRAEDYEKRLANDNCSTGKILATCPTAEQLGGYKSLAQCQYACAAIYQDIRCDKETSKVKHAKGDNFQCSSVSPTEFKCSIYTSKCTNATIVSSTAAKKISDAKSGKDASVGTGGSSVKKTTSGKKAQ